MTIGLDGFERAGGGGGCQIHGREVEQWMLAMMGKQMSLFRNTMYLNTSYLRVIVREGKRLCAFLMSFLEVCVVDH